MIMAYPNATIYALGGPEGIRRQDLADTEHFTITRDFLNRPEHMMAALLDENDS